MYHNVTLNSEELTLLLELLNDIASRPTYHLGADHSKVGEVRALRGRLQGFKEREV